MSHQYNQMRIVTRGKFKTLVHDDNTPVVAEFEATVMQAPRLVNGKMYVTVSLDPSNSIVYVVDEEIKRYQPVQYSPVLKNGTLLVMKIAGDALADRDVAVLDVVDIRAKLGSFGDFGYCWVINQMIRK